MAEFSVRGLSLGSGRPKICAPLCFESYDAFLAQMPIMEESPAEIVEWRADIYDMCGDMGRVLDMLGQIRTCLDNKPLIFTCRTAAEGGSAHCSSEYYVNLLKTVAESSLADIIDIELSAGEAAARELLAAAKSSGTANILSYHNFMETPSPEDIGAKLNTMLKYDTEIYKVAYMPKTKSDVLSVMQAAIAFTSEHPDKMLISISMGAVGAVSRIMADFLGSPLTFGSAGNISAPGQIDAKELVKGLDFMYRHCSLSKK